MTLARIILALLFVTARPLDGRALDASQAAAIDKLASAQQSARGTLPSLMASHYAILLWVEDYCDGRSDETVRSYIMKKGSANESEFEAGWLSAMDMLGKTDVKAMCALAAEQYGPSGALIPKGWQPKPKP